MQVLRSFWYRLRTLGRHAKVSAEIDEEVRDHIARETAANIRRGVAPLEAHRMAMASFGGVHRFTEAVRDEHSVRWMQDTAKDVKLGLRLMRTNRVFSGAVIGTLAIGIGATSTIFTIVNGVLLQPLPYAVANHIVSVSEVARGRMYNSVTRTVFDGWHDTQRSFAALAGYGVTTFVLTGAGEPAHIRGGQTTASFFTVLGVQPVLGRVYREQDEFAGAAKVAVIGEPLWRTRFGADSGVIGKTITLDDVPRMVIGVMPASFDLPRTAQYWVPLPRLIPGARVRPNFEVIGRIRDGVTTTAARRELATLLRRADDSRPQVDRGNDIALTPLHEYLYGSASRPLSLLFAAVLVLLLIACANVANLSLARAIIRRREFAVRLALGASRFRLIRQLLIESLLLAIVGGAVGLSMPWVLVNAMLRLSPATFAGVADVPINVTVLAFAAAVTAMVTIAFGLAPALSATNARGSVSLSSGTTRSGESKAHATLRSALVAFQIAAALTLITGAGLVTKSFARALRIDTGFDAQHVYSAMVQLPNSRYSEPRSVQQFYQTLAREAAAIPGVQSVSLSDALPLSAFQYSAFVMPPGGIGSKQEVAVSAVDDAFGRTLGLKLIAGRFVNASDVIGAPAVVVITRSAARALFPGGNALGHSLRHRFQGNDAEPVVVGIVDDVVQSGVEQQPMPQLFLSAAQMNMWPTYLTVRTSLDAATYQRALKRIIEGIDPLQPLSKFIDLNEALSQSVAPRRFNALLINAFAAVALLLAVVGLYALMANAVVARTREVGIRMALGADARGVMRLVLRHGLLLTVAGLSLGIVTSFALATTMSSFLFQVTVHDASVFLAAPLALGLVACVACYLPARSATRVNPIVALRHE